MLTFCAVAHNMLELFCLSSCTVKSLRLDSLFLDGAGEGEGEVTATESLVWLMMQLECCTLHLLIRSPAHIGLRTVRADFACLSCLCR